MTSHNILDHVRLFTLIPLRVLFWPFMLFPIRKNKIIFSNFNGRGYGCSPKYICEALLRKEKNLDLVWMTECTKSLPPQVRSVSMKSFRALWEFATAKVWVSNNRLPFYIDKKKNQYYIQTWHGCLGFKECEAGIPNMPLYYKLRSKHDSKMMDLLMMNSDFATKYFRGVFWYNGPIMEEGSPRNDRIVTRDESLENNVYKHYKISPNTKILLYAPTFRQNTDLSIFKLPFKTITNELGRKFGGKWITLVRLHPILTKKAGLLDYSDDVINASDYDDFQELLEASHVCITDYSSGLFDFIISKKPAFFYAPDMEEYEKERHFVYKPQELPVPMAKSIEELTSTISKFDNEKYLDSLNRYYKFVGLKESGHASDIVASKIIETINRR